MSRSSISGVMLAAALAATAQARTMPAVEPALEAERPAILERSGFVQNMRASLPLDASFRDEEGLSVTPGQYFGQGRPVILSLVCFDCPMLCNLVLNGLVESLRAMSLVPGQDYELVTVSFDPEETHVLAGQKKANYLADLGRPEAAASWHYLTGEAAAIQRLTEAVGFRYARDEQSGEFAHGSGIMVVTPEGKLSHHLFGVEYAPRDLRLALVEASSGRIGSALDKLQLFCYQYDHALGRYSARLMAVVQVACGLTIFALGSFLVVMFRRESAQRRSAKAVA
mgnify:CR=1 FL=1